MIQYQKDNITVFQSALYMTTTAIIQTEKAIIMTDPTWLPSEIEEIKSYLNRIIGSRQLYIIYTHSDFDHIIGSGAFPEAKVIVSLAFQENPNKAYCMKQVEEFDQKYYISRSYSPVYPTGDFVISKDGQKIELDTVTLTFYLAPGHTNDGIFTVVEPYGVLIAGDYLSDVEFPFICSSYIDYGTTIHKAESILHKHRIATLIPGHGLTTDNCKEIQKRIDSSKYYLQQLPLNADELESFLVDKYPFYEEMKSNHASNKEMAKGATSI